MISVSVSVAELSPGAVSVIPAGGLIFTVLARFPLGDEIAVAFTVQVTEDPRGMFIVALIFPVPFAPDVQVQVMFVRFGENELVIVAPITPDGPTGFEATMVYCIEALAS